MTAAMGAAKGGAKSGATDATPSAPMIASTSTSPATDAPQSLDRSGIAALIPHSGAMCLLERLDRWDRQRIVCSATSHRDTANPLRTRRGLLAPAAIEYAAQAMALHGALIGRADGLPITPGYLASARGVTLHVLRLDDLPLAPAGSGGAVDTEGSSSDDNADELRIEATRQAGDARQILYAFTVHHAGRAVAEGRAAVVLNTPIAA